MPRIRDEALALRRWDWSETSQAALLFSRNHGLIRVLAKGARRDRAPFSGGIEPLTLGEFGAIIKHTTDLATLTDWDLREVFRGPRGSARGFLVGHYIADAVRSCVHDADPHESLWHETVRALRAQTGDAEAALARFQWALLVETGYAPELPYMFDSGGSDSSTWAYAPAAGVFVAGGLGGESWRIRDESLAALIALAGWSDGPAPGADSLTIERVNRFLAACVARTLDEPPATMVRLFGDAAGGPGAGGEAGRAGGR